MPVPLDVSGFTRGSIPIPRHWDETTDTRRWTPGKTKRGSSMLTKLLRAMFKISLIFQLALFPAFTGTRALWASTDNPKASTLQVAEKKPPHEWLEARWGGQFKVQGALSWIEDESLFEPVGTGTYYDGNIQGRLNNRLLLGDWGRFDTHYELLLSGGDTRRKTGKLEDLFPSLLKDGLMAFGPLEDDRRFLDLTRTIHEDKDRVIYHRLDRLSLTLLPKWGWVRVGRQAVTWGNGLLFNPMDLFNPFSPTDIARDYKIGDDMVSLQYSTDKTGDVQFLYVPRRDPSTGDAAWNEGSLAGKLHFARGTTEFDIMAARHFDDAVVGLGGTGYLGDAAWRLDATWTFLERAGQNDDYLSLVANLDYSWVWWEKNLYGFIEFFYNGLGDNQYAEAFADPDMRNRLDRGELFVLGRTYLSAHLQIELHPLFHFLFTVINNLADPSGVIQPRAVWDMAQDFQVTLGGNLAYGGRGTEFGGFKIPGTPFLTDTSDSVFLWLTCFF
jgi:hypothetical protein